MAASPPELVEKESVGDDHAEDDHDHVEELAETEVEVVLGVAGTEVQEILGEGWG